MANLKDHRLIWLKGGLFALLGILSAGLLMAELPDLRSISLFVLSIWAFCRAYYFAFYVIEHYVDPGYRFAGLLDFFRYAVLGESPDRRSGEEHLDGSDPSAE
ncbi:hypothetical protein FYK55_26165 [Roseiconus nitratireducens]|uniref:Uncharacterized protein n=1 Tax=Roseiconus nitratireducens TaxID=2605748 RepID=A0A5M6CUL4_9BACT|nr:hypothetical protein [Roseiconus nitratireducens]KAA5538924.1 hypothetical protein FYK55_26165 [Roseiconus nitratireducens]